MPQTAQELQLNLDSKLRDLQSVHDSVEENWASFRDAVHAAALEALGCATRYHHDWYDENDSELQTLLGEKHRLVRAHENDSSRRRGKLPSPTCTAKFSASYVYAPCKTPGSVPRPIKSKAMPTDTTQKGSTMH